MHSNAVQALAGNTLSALRTPKTFTVYSHSPILRVLRDRVFPVCQTTGTVTGNGTALGMGLGMGLRMGMGMERYPQSQEMTV